MQLKPLGDRVIIQPAAREATTKAGIVIPDSASEDKPEQGEVIAVGPGKILDNGERSKMDVEVGQKVLFSKYGPTEIKLDGEEYLVANAADILAVIE